MQWIRPDQAYCRAYLSCLGLWLVILLAPTGWSAVPERSSVNGDLIASSVSGASYSQAPLGQLMSAPVPAKRVSIAEDSLWAGLLLNFAIQRDPELAKLAQKQNTLNRFVYGNVMALGALNAGQSIPFLVAPNQTLGSRRIMGVIGSGMLLFGTGLQGFLEARYSKRTTQRVNLLKVQIHSVIERLSQGESPDQLRSQLQELIGPLATEEFFAIWQTTHPPQPPPLAMPLDIN